MSLTNHQLWMSLYFLLFLVLLGAGAWRRRHVPEETDEARLVTLPGWALRAFLWVAVVSALVLAWFLLEPTRH